MKKKVMKPDWDLLEQLTALPGLSGFEEPVRRFIAQRLEQINVPFEVDSLGNLVAHIAGEGPRVLFVAHMDEVGHVVSKIRADGYLSIERIGGVSAAALSGQPVQVWTTNGFLPGVVGVYPQHLERLESEPPQRRPFVDIGVRSREEALACGVRVGAVVTYAPNFTRLNQRLIRSKALDNRVGCYLLLQLAIQWGEKRPPTDLFLAFTVQEESNLRGAVPVARAVAPQYIVGLDVTLAFDTPDLAPLEQSEVVLGKGPALKIMDHLPGSLYGTIAHPGLRAHIEDIAAQEGIPLQYEVMMGLTTAISPLAFVEAGMAAIGLSIPSRYNHSPVEVVSTDDIEAAAMLLQVLVASPWPEEAGKGKIKPELKGGGG
jgi:putative aminopeptidase FrvX